ncbi:hypothetical protein TNCV_2953491 [Trichonephila clavipes]|nr:hypothetical protein TNCV_2953491 [Trichonephila clavipes]
MLIEEWSLLSQELLDTLVLSMDRRCRYYPMIYHSCSIRGRPSDLEGQHNTLAPYRACWVTTGYLLSCEIVISHNYETLRSAKRVLETLQEIFFWDGTQKPRHVLLEAMDIVNNDIAVIDNVLNSG